MGSSKSAGRGGLFTGSGYPRKNTNKRRPKHCSATCQGPALEMLRMPQWQLSTDRQMDLSPKGNHPQKCT